MTEYCGDDLIVWPDDTNCYGFELHEMTYMGDDYVRLLFDTPEYHEACTRLGLD